MLRFCPTNESDICSLVDAQAQADPKFQSPFLYACISARALFSCKSLSACEAIDNATYKLDIISITEIALRG